MKVSILKLRKPLFCAALLFFLLDSSFAQSKKQVREAQKTAEVTAMINEQSYIFTAEYVEPMRGGNHYITPEYDLTVTTDSLIAYLPYFGRAYVAPIYPDDGGVKFTSTSFEYKKVETKNGWDITIKPKDTKETRSMLLSVSKGGYATLHVNSNNRDPISYQGYVQVKKKKV